MATRTASLCIILLITFGLRAAWCILQPPSRIPEGWLRPPLSANAESLLAFGARIPLACADIADLELIPGVSDRLATELLAKRDLLLRHARTSSEPETLQLVHGIGAHTAAALSKLLSLEDSCFQGERFEVVGQRSPSSDAE